MLKRRPRSFDKQLHKTLVFLKEANKIVEKADIQMSAAH